MILRGGTTAAWQPDEQNAARHQRRGEGGPQRAPRRRVHAGDRVVADRHVRHPVQCGLVQRVGMHGDPRPAVARQSGQARHQRRAHGARKPDRVHGSPDAARLMSVTQPVPAPTSSTPRPGFRSGDTERMYCRQASLLICDNSAAPHAVTVTERRSGRSSLGDPADLRKVQHHVGQSLSTCARRRSHGFGGVDDGGEGTPGRGAPQRPRGRLGDDDPRRVGARRSGHSPAPPLGSCLRLRHRGRGPLRTRRRARARRQGRMEPSGSPVATRSTTRTATRCRTSPPGSW